MTRRQCKACPWKVSTKADRDIPGGYCREKHRDLASTIAKPGEFVPGQALRVFACHESAIGGEVACVGWLVNQLGPGNNIALRIAAIREPAMVDVETVGPQHHRIEDTIPKDE